MRTNLANRIGEKIVLVVALVLMGSAPWVSQTKALSAELSWNS